MTRTSLVTGNILTEILQLNQQIPGEFDDYEADEVRSRLNMSIFTEMVKTTKKSSSPLLAAPMELILREGIKTISSAVWNELIDTWVA